jgi:hypothetical protein
MHLACKQVEASLQVQSPFKFSPPSASLRNKLFRAPTRPLPHPHPPHDPHFHPCSWFVSKYSVAQATGERVAAASP